MDPVLSSSVDFQEYINKNLRLTGTKAPTTSAKTSRPVSATSTRSGHVGSGIATEDLSHDFLQLNLRKYDQVSTMGHPALKAQGGISNSYASPTTMQVPLQHSWRAHLLSRPTTAQAQDKATPSGNGIYQVQSRDSAEWSDAAKDTQATDWPQHKGSNGPERHKVRTARVHLSSTGGAESKSLGADEFGEYRVRMVTQQRMFRTWADRCRHSKRQLALASRDVLENALYWGKYSAWVWWKCLHSAVSFHRNACRRRVIDRLWRNYKLSKRRRLQLRRATRLHAFVKASQFLQRLVVLGRKRRARNLAHAKLIRAYNFRNTRLAFSALTAWKQFIQKIKTDRLLDAEQAMRRDKIAAFMRRVQTPEPSAAASVAPGRSAGVSSAATGAGRSASAGRKLPPARPGQDHLPSRIPRRDDAQAKSSRGVTRATTGAARRSPPAGAFDQKAYQRLGDHPAPGNASRSTDDNKPSGADRRDYKQMTDEPSDEEEVYDEDFELDGGDGDSDGDALKESEAPPSYEALVRSSQQPDRAAGQPRTTRRRSEEGGALSTPPVTARAVGGGRTAATGISTSARVGSPRHSTGYGTATMEATAHLTLEERAAARRQRTLQLKRQAEERVQEKAQQRAALDQQKRQREIEEDEAVRKEARAKQLQAKALHDRQRADQTEALRELLSRAKRFRATQLLVRWGLAPWQQYLELIRSNNMKADSYRADRLLQAAWTALLGYVIARRTERYRWEHRHTALAVAHYRRKLLKFVWRTFRLHHKHLVAKSKALTGHFSRFTLCRRSFHAWRVAYERSIRLEVRKLRSMQPRGDLARKRHYFRQWYSYYLGLLEEREIRMRVNSKWAAVQSWMGNS